MIITLLKTAGCLALASMSALALDAGFVNDLQRTAQKIERDATVVQQALKSKNHDAADVKGKIEAMTADVAALHELTKSFEAGNPQLSGRDQADWARLREKVQVLGIFHENKRRLASDDLAKNRTLIRAYAEGVAQRAKKLQATAAGLQRSPLS